MSSHPQIRHCLSLYQPVIVELPQPRQLVVLVLRPDVFPHDEQDGGADEAELDGAGEEEGAAALMQIMHHLQAKHERFPRTEGFEWPGPVSVSTMY